MAERRHRVVFSPADLVALGAEHDPAVAPVDEVIALPALDDSFRARSLPAVGERDVRAGDEDIFPRLLAPNPIVVGVAGNAREYRVVGVQLPVNTIRAEPDARATFRKRITVRS